MAHHRYKLEIEFEPPDGAPNKETEQLGVQLLASIAVIEFRQTGARVFEASLTLIDGSPLPHAQDLSLVEMTEPTAEEYEQYLRQRELEENRIN